MISKNVRQQFCRKVATRELGNFRFSIVRDLLYAAVGRLPGSFVRLLVNELVMGL